MKQTIQISLPFEVLHILNEITIEEDEDLCARFPGELCAHICVPTGGSSYRCECREGFQILADGKTCQQATQYDR